jgi:hypothetical protein
MVDLVVHRKDLKETIVRIVSLLAKLPPQRMLLEHKPAA